MGLEGRRNSHSTRYAVSFCSDENILKFEVIVAILYEYTKKCLILHFNSLSFMVHELYLYKVLLKKTLRLRISLLALVQETLADETNK